MSKTSRFSVFQEKGGKVPLVSRAAAECRGARPSRWHHLFPWLAGWTPSRFVKFFQGFFLFLNGYTPWNKQIAPERLSHPKKGKEKVFQASIFRCELLVSGMVVINKSTDDAYIGQEEPSFFLGHLHAQSFEYLQKRNWYDFIICCLTAMSIWQWYVHMGVS